MTMSIPRFHLALTQDHRPSLSRSVFLAKKVRDSISFALAWWRGSGYHPRTGFEFAKIGLGATRRSAVVILLLKVGRSGTPAGHGCGWRE